MRLLLALLLALAASLNGSGLSASATEGLAAQARHVEAYIDQADDGSSPCDCCRDEGQASMDACVCACTPALAAQARTPIPLAVPVAFLAKPPEQALRSRAPEPPRRPPRLVS